MNTSYTRLITTTLQNHGKEIFDAVSTNNALFYMLKKRGNIKMVGGGRTFTHPIYHTASGNFGAIAKLDPIPTALQEDATRAEFDVKIVAGSLVLSTLEEAMNAGQKEQLIKLAREVKEGGEISMTEICGDQVWKDGSSANDFDGLQNLISLTPTTGTVGGINRANYSYWRNETGTDVSAFNTSSEGITNMNSLLNACTYGHQGPTAVFTTKAVYGLYELSMTSNIRHLSTELGDSSFRHLAYSTLPVLFDDNCPSGQLYMVDLNNLWMQILSQGNFQVTDFQRSINSLSRVALMYVFGNMTMGSARTQGVIASVA